MFGRTPAVITTRSAGISRAVGETHRASRDPAPTISVGLRRQHETQALRFERALQQAPTRSVELAIHQAVA